MGWGWEGGTDPFAEYDPLAWLPEEDPFKESVFADEQFGMPGEPIDVTPSEFVNAAFRMPRDDGMGYENFSFADRRHMRMPYDSNAKRILLIAARQVEKSTLLGNKALSYCCTVPAFKALYVSPSALQTKTFSNDRVKEPIETSPILKAFTTFALSQNVFEKQFINRSKITLRYAFLNADRARGIPSWMLLIDELQDVLSDNIPVIEHCLSHAPDMWKRYIYAGTPKSLDNTIEWYRSNLSTQGEWVIPCDRCGSNAEGAAGRYWNILGERNIGKDGLVCSKCFRPIDPQHGESQWAFMVEWDEKKTPFESYRVCQLMVPWKKWSEILYEYENNSRAQFFNESLGISYDSGLRPMTMAQVRAACNPDVYMSDAQLDKWRSKGYSQPVYMGLDWGTGECSYTVITIGTYVDMKLQVFYVERCVAELLEPDKQLEYIKDLVNFYNVRVIGADYGGGYDRNDRLMRWFGPERLVKFQYMARSRKKVEWDPGLRRFKANRTEVMSDVFNAIKRKMILFPRWEEFHANGKVPYATDILNIYSEYSNSIRAIVYKHAPDKPDDTLHSLVYMVLGSMLIVPRPDIIAPRREDPARPGLNYGGYTGPVSQG
jgi:hypothetical protein